MPHQPGYNATVVLQRIHGFRCSERLAGWKNSNFKKAWLHCMLR